MKRKKFLLMLTIGSIGVLLGACGQPAIADTPAIPNTDTPPPPTMTSAATTAATATPIPSATPGPAVIAPLWSQLPLLPEVIEGTVEEMEMGVLYAANIEAEEAEVFYQEVMEAGGWELTKREYAEVSIFGGPAITLTYQRNEETAVIMLIYSTNENYTMVFLSGFTR